MDTTIIIQSDVYFNVIIVKNMTLRLFQKKECRILTLRSWLILIAILLTILLTLFCNIHPFLAVSEPLPAEILVVEGWMPDYCMKVAQHEFNSRNYLLIVTTGEPVIYGYYLTDYKNHAQIAAATLCKLGFDSTHVKAVSGDGVEKDRTYASAMAVRNWLTNSRWNVHAINLLSLGAHARRSRLIFQKALGDQIKVGVIAAENLSYDDKNWWRTSNGVRTVLAETIAYIYAKIFFYPKQIQSLS